MSGCRHCHGALTVEPLAPDGVVHATGDLLCPGHTTVSSDGSNVAQRGCAATCAYAAPEGLRWAVACHFQADHPGDLHTDGSVTWTSR